MTARAIDTHPAAPRPGATPVPRRVPALTPRDRARIAAHGRPGLLRRLRRRAAVAWTAVVGSTVVGLTTLAASPVEDDSGLWILMASIPLTVVAAHQQATMQRIQLNDPDRPVPIPLPRGTAGSAPGSLPEVEDLALLRDRLLRILPALQAKHPSIASEVRAADEQAFAALEVQGQVLVTLQGLPDPQDAAAEEARDEVRRRLRSGIAQYQDLLTQCLLLHARSESSALADGSLARATDLVATHSEGLRVAGGLDQS